MGRILIAGEPGNDIVPELYPLPGETVIEKPGKGAFYATPLSEILDANGITHLVFAGVTTEVCVQTTMREAADRGFETLIAEDATESYFPEFKTAAIDMITAQGGIVGCAAPSNVIIEALNGKTP
jgi:nicotinamidase-related amidase